MDSSGSFMKSLQPFFEQLFGWIPWLKKRTHFWKMSFDPHKLAMACIHTHDIYKCTIMIKNKNDFKALCNLKNIYVSKYVCMYLSEGSSVYSEFVEVRGNLLGVNPQAPPCSGNFSWAVYYYAVFTWLTGPLASRQFVCLFLSSHWRSTGILDVHHHNKFLYGFQGLNSSCQACMAKAFTCWTISLALGNFFFFYTCLHVCACTCEYHALCEEVRE